MTFPPQCNMGSHQGQRLFSTIPLRRWLAGVVAVCGCLQSAWANEPQAGAAIAAAHAQLLQRAQAGPVRVIVSLRDPQDASSAPGTVGAPFNAASDEGRVRLVQDAVGRVVGRLNALRQRLRPGLGASNVSDSGDFRSFTYSAGFVMKATEADLQQLMADPEVIRVQADGLSKPSLSETGPLLGMVSNQFQGFSGGSQLVAILDSGVDKSHPSLTGRVVSEACYSSNYSDASFPEYNSTSLCPSGVPASTAAGSGVHCDTGISGCGHGTHVGGIVASQTPRGMAGGAQLLAIQVFSRFNSAAACDGPGPCILSWNSDQIAGLERVYALRTSYRMASANMSLGGGGSNGACDGEPQKPIIDLLRTAHVATAIASGNDGYSDRISYPACISSAISVGSTTKADTVSGFSNGNANLRLLAPGSEIYSTLPNGNFASWYGTSMATPHVAGAWATLKEADPTASVSLVEKALKDTGRYVADTRNGMLQPRIHIDRGVSALLSWSRLWPGKPVTGAGAPANLPRYFTVEVPPGATSLAVTSAGGAGARGLYVRHGNRPSTSVFDCSHTVTGTSHTCSFPLPTAGTYHVMLYSAANAFSGVTVSANYNNPPLAGCAPSAPTTTLPAAINGKTVLNQCGRILSAASGGTDLQQHGVAHLSSKEGVVLKTGFKARNGARLWARVQQEP